MKIFWFILACFIAIPTASAQFDFTFTWVDPTQRTDGTAFNANTALKSYRLNCAGPANAERIVDRAATVAVNTTTRRYEWSNAVTVGGTYTCRMTAIDTGDRESTWSNTASVTKFATPSAPTDFQRIP
jgi:hypothetical protein